MKRALQTLFFLVLIPSFILGQGKFKVSGKVTDATGEPLIGANVMIRALNAGNTTDLDGNYSFEIPKDIAKNQRVELTASFINYKKKSVNVVLDGNNIKQDFLLEEDLFQNEEIVVTGIASKTSKSVAEVSVARISASDLQGVNAYSGLSQLVAGKVSGVQMTTSSGNIGGGWRFQVRGGGGLNGDGQPTMYVDGVRVENTEIGLATGGQLNNTIAGLNANDIEKIEFLKGPAAAAMYGTNGANGVVLITTKTGKLVQSAKKGLSVEYRFNYGYNEKQYNYKQEDYGTADVANRIFKKGPLREHYINIAGGGSELRYYASLENRVEDGILPTSSGDRTTARINIVAYPYNNLNIKLTSNYINNKVLRPNNDNTIYGYLGNVLLAAAPFGWTSEVMLGRAKSDANTNQFIGSLSATYTPIDYLEINASFGMDNSDYREERSYPLGFNGLVPKGEKGLYHRNNVQMNYEMNAAYSYTIDDFKFKSTIGAQFFDRRVKTIYVLGQEFNSDLITTLASAGKITGYDEAFGHNREGGIYTEHSVNYLDQYFLTLGIRKDYATAIGKNAPSITYPKASFAVRIDKYDFLPSFIGLLKFRAAYGENGILPGTIAGIPKLWTTAVGAYGAGAAISAIGNDKIEPERVKEFEFGLDAELFKEVSFEFTYYMTDAVNSIINKPTINSSGYNALAQPYNLGKATASGFESLIQYSPIRGNEFNLDLTLIWNYQTNKVDDLGPSADIFADPNAVAKGYPKFQFYTFKTKDVVYDAAGKYLRAVSTDTRVDCGSPIPDHSGSFTLNFRFLKNFNLYAFAEWGLNNKIYNMTQVFANRFGNGKTYNDYKAKLGLAGGTAGVAALTPGTAEYKQAAVEYGNMDPFLAGNYVQDASFLIVREISLSYDFTELLQSFDVNTYIKNLAAGLSVRNVATFSEYDGADIGLNYAGGRSTVSRAQDFLTLQTPRTVNLWVRLGL